MHVQSVQKYCFPLSNMQICGVFVAVVVAKNSLFFYKYGNHSSFRSCNFRSTTAIRRSLQQRFLKQVYLPFRSAKIRHLCFVQLRLYFQLLSRRVHINGMIRNRFLLRKKKRIERLFDRMKKARVAIEKGIFSLFYTYRHRISSIVVFSETRGLFVV